MWNKETWKKIKEQAGPGKLIALLAVGLALLFLSMPGTLPSGQKQEEKEAAAVPAEEKTEESYREEMEGRLEELLSQVQGIGRVKVMITLSESSERVVLKDTPVEEEEVSEDNGGGAVKKSTKISRDEATVGDSPYVVKTVEPTVQGVVVIAEGGENMMVVSDIVDAVKVLFDLPAHKIKVMKYK